MSDLFVTVMADPAWQYRDKLRMSKTKRSSEDQYRKTMTVDEICAMYTPSRIQHEPALPGAFGTRQRSSIIPGRLLDFNLADEGFLILWCTAAALLEGNAVRVCNAWGYTPTQLGVWIKGRVQIFQPRDGAHGNAIDAGLLLQIGMGWALRNAAEFFIVGTRGKYTKLVKDKGRANVLLAEEDLVMLAEKREHSRKPDQMYDLIERTFEGPYLELFAKYRREGWTQHGDELPPLELKQPTVDLQQPITYTLLAPNDDGVYERHDDVLPDPGLEGQWPD